MSFVANDSQQFSLDDPLYRLSGRQKKFLKGSWAAYFADHIFPKIDESLFAPLYSDKASRPNTPVNVTVGALILKEFNGQSDDGLLSSLLFDFRYQYALHTTSFQNQPMSDRTLGRFRARCVAYETETGVDLIKQTMNNLADEMAALMGIDGSLKRMDSMMVASNIKKMGRLELLYTCLANLINELDSKNMALSERLLHYTEKDDKNLVIYHNRSEETGSKIDTVLADSAEALKLCNEEFEESSNYLLLKRVLKEQAVLQEDGTYRLRTKEDGGMDGNILQNPADPEATFREKAGRQNRGYVGNITESVGENGSIVTDYQFEQNTHSDSDFFKEAVTEMGAQENPVVVITDGAFAGEENAALAKENNITLISTNLTGRETDEINAGFEFDGSGTKVLKCPGGHAPKSCCYNQSNETCTASFHKSNCEKCPYKKQCRPKEFKRTCRKTISIKTKHRAEQQRFRRTEEFKKYSRIRNGVETVPSYLRRKYAVDQMPVRGKIRCKLLFGLKLGAANFKKLCNYLQGQDKCAQKAVMA